MDTHYWFDTRVNNTRTPLPCHILEIAHHLLIHSSIAVLLPARRALSVVALAGSVYKVHGIPDRVVRVADAASWRQHCTRLRLRLQRAVNLACGDFEPLQQDGSEHDSC
jgi:hypothetical protein